MKKLIFVLVLGLLMLLVACGGGSDTPASSGNGGESGNTVSSTGDPTAGEAKYNEVCIACHGPAGAGVEGLGKPFTTSDFVPSQTDDELLAFIKTGRPISHPDNTTGVDMPPKGGNPALTDEQIIDIIAYIRALHE